MSAAPKSRTGESTTMTEPDPATTSRLCYDGKHARCSGRVYVWPDNEPVAHLAPCTCGCGCNSEVPITRPNAARTRRRNLGT